LFSRTIAWINQSTSDLNDADCVTIVNALNIQAQDLAADWPSIGLINNIYVGTDPGKVPVGSDKAYFLPNSTVAGALGFHDRDPADDPYINVFTSTILGDGGTKFTGAISILVCAGHEMCELGGDPNCDQYSPPMPPAGQYTGYKIALELGDPVEASAYDVTLPGGMNVSLTDYVLPSFFDPNGKAPFDKMQLLQAPFAMLAGGYEILRAPDGSLSQIFAQHEHAGMRARWKMEKKEWVNSRTARRLRNG
jgi:hypothetical protein